VLGQFWIWTQCSAAVPLQGVRELEFRSVSVLFSVHSFSALTLSVGRQEGHLVCRKLEWGGAGVVICLERGADLHTAQLMPLPLTVSCSVKSTLVLPSGTGSPG